MFQPRRLRTPNSLPQQRTRLSLADYDRLSPPLAEQVKKAPRFVLHVAEGPCVAEVWETKEQHDSFFNENVCRTSRLGSSRR
jgi:hypothetical protein